MERIISYDELPISNGRKVYFRMETDPKLYMSLLMKGYKIINNIKESDDSTIYITGRRQDYNCRSFEEYKEYVDNNIQEYLKNDNFIKPNMVKFSYDDLIEHKYSIPFVLKNENQNGGREKFLINTEEDYENLIKACKFLIQKKSMDLFPYTFDDIKFKIDYKNYLDLNFSVQEYIKTPSKYNTTVRLLSSSSNDLLYAALKYNEAEDYMDDTTLLGYLLKEVYPISTKSIVSNTLSGGKNILIGSDNYKSFEKKLLSEHDINSEKFESLINSSLNVHEKYDKELGIICGFDYIYDQERENWYLLEYHSRPMVGDYSRRQCISYETKDDRISAEGRVRATALSLKLKKID